LRRLFERGGKIGTCEEKGGGPTSFSIKRSVFVPRKTGGEDSRKKKGAVTRGGGGGELSEAISSAPAGGEKGKKGT